MDQLKTLQAKHIAHDRMKTGLLKNIVSRFEVIETAEQFATVNEKLQNNDSFRIGTINHIKAKFDIAAGFKTATKTAFKGTFGREFLKSCSWIPVGNCTALKDSELIKILIRKSNFCFSYVNLLSEPGLNLS